MEQLFLKKNLNFNKGRSSYSYGYVKHNFDIFGQSGILPATVNMEPLLIFGKEILLKLLTCLHCESIDSFGDESCTIGYISKLN